MARGSLHPGHGFAAYEINAREALLTISQSAEMRAPYHRRFEITHTEDEGRHIRLSSVVYAFEYGASDGQKVGHFPHR